MRIVSIFLGCLVVSTLLSTILYTDGKHISPISIKSDGSIVSNVTSDETQLKKGDDTKFKIIQKEKMEDGSIITIYVHKDTKVMYQKTGRQGAEVILDADGKPLLYEGKLK